MRIEGNYGRHRARRPRPFHHRAHDQLVTKMQTIKHAEREYGRPLNLCVVSSVEETHFFKLPISDCRLPIYLRCKPPRSNWQSAMFMTPQPNHRRRTRHLTAVWLSRDRV